MEKHEPPLTVAIVDDDESVLDAIKTVLDDQEWNTQTYSSGEFFLSDIKNYKPDCIILDSNLHGLSGLAVARTIMMSDKNIPIIVLTAYPESTITLKIKTLGVYGILVKPVTAEVLITQIIEAVTQNEFQAK
ncbi:MAG: two-component system response regulator FixJ [Cocleimonas sp.]|jgi:two-component system response regulator FixJ